MKLDTMIQLINDLRTNAITDDVDPANVLLQTYQTPYDILTLGDSIRIIGRPLSTVYTWSDGTTYVAYDSNGVAYDAPSCGWVWGSGGLYDQAGGVAPVVTNVTVAQMNAKTITQVNAVKISTIT